MRDQKEWDKIADQIWDRVEVALRNHQYKRLHARFRDTLDMTDSEIDGFFRWLYESRIMPYKRPARVSAPSSAQKAENLPDSASGTGSGTGYDADSFEINEDDDGLSASSRGRSVTSLDELISAAKIDIHKWTVLEWSANTWEGFYRSGETHKKVPLWQVKARFVPSVLANIEAVKVQGASFPYIPRIVAGDKPKVCVVIPDTQHGFRWNDLRTRLIPMHDRRAIDCVVQLIERLKPDLIVHLGDGPDFAEWSTKFPREPNLIETTQPALEELHHDLARFRAASPDSRFIYLEGNHCFRIRSALIEKLPVALSAKAVGDKREALHIARLLDFDGLGIEYVGPYGSYSDDWYWEDRVRFVHDGGVKGKGGQTVASHVEHADCTTVFGHIHRLEMAGRTTHRNGKIKTIYAASAGCLCRIDGHVPAATPRPDWQHGCAVVTLTERSEFVMLLPIERGRMAWCGEEIVGQDYGKIVESKYGRPVG
jgi:hypothetical protein